MTTHELLLSQFATVSFGEVVTASGLSADELSELVELGACEPCHREGSEVYFPASAIEAARLANRLRSDFEMPLAGVALLLAYRERIRELEEKLLELECRLPSRIRD